MGCTSSSTKDKNAAVDPKQTTEVSRTAEEPHVALGDEGLIPGHHKDQFGNEIDDKTGGRVWSAVYYQARKDAEEHAVQRGKYFERSKAAFEKGDKPAAKELSDQGKKQGELMEAANQKAVKEILGPQNLPSSTKLDLHGLLVSEAVDATTKFAESKIGKETVLEVITGAGHHSDTAKGAVIKPAIVKLCKEKGWTLVPVEKNDGAFMLHLPASIGNTM